MTDFDPALIPLDETPPEGLSPEELEKWIYERNCLTVASAAEDLHNRNMAEMALISVNDGVEINAYELFDLKLELLVDHILGSDVLRRQLLNFQYQQKIAEYLAHKKAHATGEGHTHGE
jgi:hypothetical protein